MVSGGAWPGVEAETYDWHDSWRTYDATVVAVIAGRDVTEVIGHRTAALVGQAQQAIADFDRQFTDEFGQTELGTIDTVLMRSEASSSSQIEHVTVSAKQLALAEIDASRSVNARLVRGNVLAMAAAIDHEGGFDTESAIQLQRDVLGETDLHIGLRQEQVWIGTSAAAPVGADFVPPHHTRVAEALDDLWAFLGEEAHLPLAHAAIGHAQFETIHPFVDGNGRVGRALVHRYLRHVGLTSHVTVPVSAGLLTSPHGYVNALTAYRRGNPGPIVDELARACNAAADIGRELVRSLRAVRDAWAGRIQARRDAVAWRVADGLVGHPAVTAAGVASEYGVTTVAARTAIATLVDAGVLRKVSAGRRNQVWTAPEVTECYDRVAELIGRRRTY